jgi:hypothetical protein
MTKSSAIQRAALADTSLADLAKQTAAMALASASVIDHRTRRMANAGMTPNARDREEFALMGQEKMDAAVEWTQATMTGMLAIQQTLLGFTLQQLLTSSAAIGSILSAKSFGAVHSALASRMIDNARSAYDEAVAHLTHTAAQALHPVHSRATANARRLAEITDARR